MKKLLFILMLTSCSQSNKVPKTIYQPKFLFLKAGVEIPTLEGNFTPETDQIWHSAQKVEELEKTISQF